MLSVTITLMSTLSHMERDLMQTAPMDRICAALIRRFKRTSRCRHDGSRDREIHNGRHPSWKEPQRLCAGHDEAREGCRDDFNLQPATRSLEWLRCSHPDANLDATIILLVVLKERATESHTRDDTRSGQHRAGTAK